MRTKEPLSLLLGPGKKEKIRKINCLKRPCSKYIRWYTKTFRSYCKSNSKCVCSKRNRCYFPIFKVPTICPPLDKEERRIKSLKMPEVISKQEVYSLTAIEHLFYSSIGCINSLAEYLHKNIFSEKLLYTLNIIMPQANTNQFPTVFVVERPNVKV